MPSPLAVYHDYLYFLGITISGDGTTHRSVNYEAKFATLMVPDYQARSSEGPPDAMMAIPADRFFGISSAPNHTSETQLAGWQETVHEFYELYNNSPLESRMRARLIEFSIKIQGMHTDHAEDQKKLARLIQQWKQLCECELRGELVLLSALPEELLPILLAESQQKIADAGGPNAWAMLSAEEQAACDVIVYKNICLHFGQAAYDALTEAEKNEVDFFIWAGCCMHKELNSVKGGNTHMTEFWKKSGLIVPIPLMNRDNAAAATAGTSAAQTRAENVTQAGAVKTASLAGALFNHKDDKKGHHDIFRIFFESHLGCIFTFPDTSNTRYQSYCLAASALILHLPLYISFLELI